MTDFTIFIYFDLSMFINTSFIDSKFASNVFDLVNVKDYFYFSLFNLFNLILLDKKVHIFLRIIRHVIVFHHR
jgi:hypothetical protein